MTEDKDSKTVLIIEDDPLNTKLTVDLLELNGFKTLSCRDGRSALETLKETIPDLILLDINMPLMNGFEVYKKIREDSRLDHIKVIAVSGSVMKEDEERVMTAGFDCFLPKPIDIKTLVKKVKEYLCV
ncbi:MAG: response regulator [Candidatus Omnitrophica bacterium]|nr:response regulator [Candidatus Omnitrophota bacterium]MDD5771817.1 response regulator [Candidatus Omnitrophota bacterium]